MTATPIPRTLSLTAYGDLDTTALRELPAGRQPVETWLVEEDAARRRPTSSSASALREGRQAFVVCPLVSESEKLQAKAAAEVEAERLRGGRAARLPGRRPARPDAPRPRRRRRWRAFAAGETDVLVATTVIEVGIDVANATVMVIEGAERYGVSQLHQLRGRVGRGEHASHCLLFAEEAGELARRRLRGGGRGARRLQARRGRPRPARRGRDPRHPPARPAALRRRRAARGHRRSCSRPARRCWRCCAATARSTRPRSGRCSRPPAAASAPAPPTRSPLRPMRVIAGELRGGGCVAPRGWKVRPTSDRVREAIFSALGDGRAAPASSTSTAAPARWRSRRSRAAPPAATLVDRDTRAGARQRRARSACGERAELVRADVGRWLAVACRRAPAPRFDLVFVDAPYRLADRVGPELDTHLPRLLAEGGRAIVESGAAQPAAARLAGARCASAATAPPTSPSTAADRSG